MEKNKFLSFPTREEIKEKLTALIANEITREDITDWAAVWVCGKMNQNIKDSIGWEMLKNILAADLKVETGEYFHDENDFKKWLDELEKAGPFIEKRWNPTSTDE